MKYLDILKKYDKAILSESKRLDDIYSKLLNEETEDDTKQLDEEKCDCGKEDCPVCNKKVDVDEGCDKNKRMTQFDEGESSDGKTAKKMLSKDEFLKNIDKDSSEEKSEDKSEEKIDDVEEGIDDNIKMSASDIFTEDEKESEKKDEETDEVTDVEKTDDGTEEDSTKKTDDEAEKVDENKGLSMKEIMAKESKKEDSEEIDDDTKTLNESIKAITQFVKANKYFR